MNTQSPFLSLVVRAVRAWALLIAALALIGLGVRSAGAGPEPGWRVFAPPEPVYTWEPGRQPRLPQSTNLIRASQARTEYNVDGSGLTVAVLDTGINPTHQDFTGKIVEQHNYTTDNGGVVNDATDGNGHGTNVSGIIVANGPPANGGHTGIAPGANVVAMKVLGDDGSGSTDALYNAFQYLIANHSRLNISVVNLSLGTSDNLTLTPTDSVTTLIRGQITQLRNEGVAVVVSAGNAFHTFNSAQGMAWPAIIPETVSAGAVYDANIGTVSYGSGAVANTTGPDRICPFSQRLHVTTNSSTATDIFAPGAALTSTGHTSDTASSLMHGTSQAAPVTAGAILLMQQYHLRRTGSLPSVDDLESWLWTGAVFVNDGDDEDDNVTNTGLDFDRIDVLASMEAIDADLGGGYNISGRVTNGASGVSGVTVSAGEATTTTDANGNYTLGGLGDGTYTVVPTKTGCTFNPPSSQVMLAGDHATGIDFSLVTYSIRGTVRVGDTPLSGVTITSGNQVVATNASGEYTLSGLLAGTYPVTPAKTEYTFTPASRNVTVTNADVNAQDFAATLNTYSISGAITRNGQAVVGAVVSLTGGPGGSDTTDAAGAFSFSGLPAGNYTITPSKSHHTFTPTNRSVTVGPNATGRDFTATAAYSISGTILEGATPLSGVAVTGGGRMTTTNGSGEYTLTGVPPGTHTVTPQKEDYGFTPVSQVVNVTDADLTDIDFQGSFQTFSLGGTLTLNGAAVEGAQVALNTGATTTTDAEGTYLFSGLATGTYTVTPTKAEHTFTPGFREVNLSTADNLDVNFTAGLNTYSVSGTVLSGGQAVPGVTVTAGGRTTTTAGDGTYMLTGLTAGTYTVVPSKLGYAFSPADRDVNVGPSQLGINFDGTQVLTLGGRITVDGVGLEGVTVTAGDRTTTTNADGEYAFNNVTRGNYTVVPALDGYLFTPKRKRVKIARKSVANAHFKGAAIPDLVDFTLKTTTVKGRRPAVGTLLLSGKAPATMLVTLSSSDAVGRVPKVVKIGRNKTSARVSIKTRKVKAPTQVTITATLNGISKQVELTVTP